MGGQAVNFWAEIFEKEETELQQYRPFASVDLDLHRLSLAGLRFLRTQAGHTEEERDPFGKAFTIVSNTFFVEDKSGKTLPVDNLKMVAGLRPKEVLKGAVEIEFGGVIVRVLNPIACLKAKLHSVGAIDQSGRQDVKHVRMLIPCTRGFVRRLIRDGGTTRNYRPALNALKELLDCSSRRKALQTARMHGFDLMRALPLAELTSAANPKLSSFVTHQLPQWQRRLENSR